LEAERRAQAESERAVAQAQAERNRAQAEATAAKAAQDRAAAQAEVERARQAAEQARRDQQELRKQLLDQFSRVLQTRETQRGLVVNMSDVLFDVGKSTLKPGAREKLIRIAAIVSGHQGLKLELEGHTDSTGSDELNQTLSEQRANAVRDFLVAQGVDASSITARGLGESEPVASNDTAAGRQMNRRVEMIVSGDIIGTPVTSGRSSSLR